MMTDVQLDLIRQRRENLTGAEIFRGRVDEFSRRRTGLVLYDAVDIGNQIRRDLDDLIDEVDRLRRESGR